MLDVALIGAGTAGLTAGIYVQRAGKQAVCFEQNVYGGQIVNSPAIENYPGFEEISGYDYVNRLYEQATKLGMEYKNEKILSVEQLPSGFLLKTETGSYEAKTVILATGAKRRQLGVPGEERLSGRGVSYCATCDGMFYRKKETIICGGGNTALDDAMFLSNYCAKVTLVHRRDGFRGDPKTLELLKEKENVEFLTNVTVNEILGEDRVTGLSFTRKDTGETGTVSAQGVFIAVGQIPDTDFVKTLVMTDEAGYVKAGEDTRTNVPGIFAAGDLRTKTVRQLTTAAADGTVAALAAVEYLGRKEKNDAK